MNKSHQPSSVTYLPESISFNWGPLCAHLQDNDDDGDDNDYDYGCGARGNDDEHDDNML